MRVSNYDVAEMLKKVRLKSGVSQVKMAEALNVSRKTVENWENGYVCPSLVSVFEWFDICKVKPTTYFLELIYPEQYKDNDPSEALNTCISALPTEAKRKLLYVFKGNHGSLPKGIIEMLCAHLHTPLRQRLNISNQVIVNYNLALKRGTVVKGEPYPDIELLQRVYDNTLEAVINNEDHCSIM